MVTTYFFHYTNLNINVNRTTITNIQENVEQTFDYWLYWTQNYLFKSVCGDRIFAAKEGSGDVMGTSASSSSRYLFSLTWPMSGYLLQTTRFRGPSAPECGGSPLGPGCVSADCWEDRRSHRRFQPRFSQWCHSSWQSLQPESRSCNTIPTSPRWPDTHQTTRASIFYITLFTR